MNSMRIGEKMGLTPKDDPDNSADKSNYHNTLDGCACNDTLANEHTLHIGWGCTHRWRRGFSMRDLEIIQPERTLCNCGCDDEYVLLVF